MKSHGSARKRAHEYEARIIKERLFETYEILGPEDLIFGDVYADKRR